jgi:hypothetical protein
MAQEPFERLLSGYADKLYSPNAAYWNFIGRYIVTNFREKPSNLSLECGHDITFEEFVKKYSFPKCTSYFFYGTIHDIFLFVNN